MNNKNFFYSLLSSSLLLTGCQTTENFEKKHFDDSQSAKKQFDNSYQRQGNIENSTKAANFGKVKRNWVNTIPLEYNDEKALPIDIAQTKISVNAPGSVNIIEVITELQRALDLSNKKNIKFKINQDLYDISQGMPRFLGSGDNSSSDTKKQALILPDFVYDGTIKGALDILAAKANVSWKWNGQEIDLYRFEVKQYNISALAGTSATDSNMNVSGRAEGGNSSGATSSTNGASVKRQATIKKWDEVKMLISAELSPQGTFGILESTGVVTIKDFPNIHKKINHIIRDMNKKMSRQIFLNVDVYTVTVQDTENRGIDWNMVWKSNSNSLSFNTLSSVSGSSTAGSVGVGVLTGPFSGSNVVLNALSGVGKASIMNQFTISTLNGQPAPISVNRKISYLAETNVTQPTTQNATPQVSFKAGELTTGINMNIVPKVEDDDKILLEYMMTLTDIENLRSIALGSSAIELPTSTSKATSQQATVRLGQSLVLAGFKQSVGKTNKNGFLNQNVPIGGGIKTSMEEQYLVIIIKPYLAE